MTFLAKTGGYGIAASTYWHSVAACTYWPSFARMAIIDWYMVGTYAGFSDYSATIDHTTV